jgi:hypothetical protein
MNIMYTVYTAPQCTRKNEPYSLYYYRKIPVGQTKQ